MHFKLYPIGTRVRVRHVTKIYDPEVGAYIPIDGMPTQDPWLNSVSIISKVMEGKMFQYYVTDENGEGQLRVAHDELLPAEATKLMKKGKALLNIKYGDIY